MLIIDDKHPFYPNLIKRVTVKPTPEFDLEILTFFTQRHNFSHEIEVEIKDLSFLIEHIDNPDNFKKILLRFMRNFESLYENLDFIDERFYSAMFKEAKVVPKPLLGDYMMQEIINNDIKKDQNKK